MPMPRIYHERQTKQLCALHALNNLFQARDTYTKEQLDDICNNLSPNVWINPHRSILGWGNYDINVIMTALQAKNFEASWFDKRKDPSCINLDVIIGLILNVPSDYKLGFVTLPLQRRHWISIRRFDGLYYNLDSKLNEPKCLGDERELLEYLRNELDANDRELFIIVERRDGSDQNGVPCWQKSNG